MSRNVKRGVVSKGPILAVGTRGNYQHLYSCGQVILTGHVLKESTISFTELLLGRFLSFLSYFNFSDFASEFPLAYHSELIGKDSASGQRYCFGFRRSEAKRGTSGATEPRL
jgi:hypothetical protein